MAATGTCPTGGKYCGGVIGGVAEGAAAGVVAGPAAGAGPAFAVWSAPHFGQKRSPFANWFPQVPQNAMALPCSLLNEHSVHRCGLFRNMAALYVLNRLRWLRQGMIHNCLTWRWGWFFAGADGPRTLGPSRRRRIGGLGLFLIANSGERNGTNEGGDLDG